MDDIEHLRNKAKIRSKNMHRIHINIFSSYLVTLNQKVIKSSIYPYITLTPTYYQ